MSVIGRKFEDWTPQEKLVGGFLELIFMVKWARCTRWFFSEESTVGEFANPDVPIHLMKYFHKTRSNEYLSDYLSKVVENVIMNDNLRELTLKYPELWEEAKGEYNEKVN